MVLIRYDSRHNYYFAGSEGSRTCFYTEMLMMTSLGFKEKRNQTRLLEKIAESLREK